MELDEFVRKTIDQVITGVGQACELAKSRGGFVGNTQSDRIEFDVAVTATEGSESKKGGGIAVWGIGANLEGKNASASSTVSRIKFSVMVKFPSSK